MNNARRKAIARAAALVEEARLILDEIAGEEREAFDNMPESLQDGERGQAMSEAADALDDMASALEDVDFDQFGES